MRNHKFSRKIKTRFFLFTISVTILAVLLVAGLFTFFQNEVSFMAQNSKPENKGTKPFKQQKITKTSTVKVDLEKEKQSLADAGFAVSRSELPAGTNPGGFRNMDMRYNFSLKDYVYNMNTIVKGKVLGTRSYIDGNIVRTEVKLLVEESLLGEPRSGDIFTFVSTGGVITEYDFWKINGNKFNLTESELEKAKNKWVVEDAWGTLVYPEDEVYVFAGNDQLTIPLTNEQAPWVSFQIKYTGGIIDKNMHFEMENSFYSQELRAMKSVEELQNKLKKMVVEKKGYSQEKAREAAYNALSKSDCSLIGNWKLANVTYLSNGTYIEGVISQPNLIEVSFRGKEPITVYLKRDAFKYKVYKVIKG